LAIMVIDSFTSVILIIFGRLLFVSFSPSSNPLSPVIFNPIPSFFQTHWLTKTINTDGKGSASESCQAGCWEHSQL
jgi:hypothetical protein